MYTTNYRNTFISVADDCPVRKAEMPPVRDGNRSIAQLHFDMLYEHPFRYTSDDVVFAAYLEKNEIKKTDQDDAYQTFFSKGQPCLRTSPLAKRYGWGIFHNDEAKVAIYPMESEMYHQLSQNKNVQQKKAMRTSKK